MKAEALSGAARVLGRGPRSITRASMFALVFGALVLGGASVVACSRAQEPSSDALASSDRGEKAEKQPASAASTPSAPTPAAKPAPDAATLRASAPRFEWPDVAHWVAIGDLHGDFDATKRAFELAGATNGEGAWVGGKLVVVQTGDQLDRGDGERDIIEFLDRVQTEAEKAGGQLHVMNGNHETMNALGDFRYVTPGALHAFDDLSPRAPLASRFPAEYQGRAGAFLPGGAMALRLSKRPVALRLGDTVFAHAGIRAPHVTHGLDSLNGEIAAWLRGELVRPPLLLQDPEGPLWTRVYGAEELDASSCKVLEEALTKLGAKHMVVGHSVQEHGMNEACSGRIHRIDVGLSKYYGQGPIQVLESKNGKFQILSKPRR